MQYMKLVGKKYGEWEKLQKEFSNQCFECRVKSTQGRGMRPMTAGRGSKLTDELYIS
jgi:hypothetical protein